MAKRIPASMRTREALSALIEGRLASPAGRSELVELATRLIVEETEVGGCTFKPGEMVMLPFPSANRDPAVFPDPDRLDLERTPNPHLAFGHGVHFCLGASLARLEAEVAFSKLFARFSKLEQVGDPPRMRPGLVFHGLESLSLRLGA